MSLLESFTDEQRNLLKKFIDRVIIKEKMINEIQKLILDQHYYARHLKAQDFDIEQAVQQLKNQLAWRKQQNIDTILDFEFKQYGKIKELCPNGFHSIDKKGRPIFIIQIGQIKFMELMSALNNYTDLFVHYFVKEMEHTWRVKFLESKEIAMKNKQSVDQVQVIIDMKGTKLKDLTNKQMNSLYKQLVLELQRFFPEMLYRAHIVNSPMFFENVWETELQKCIDKETLEKIFVSSGYATDELLEDVDDSELPAIYGGSCECQATCIYSDKGPWSDVENLINFREPTEGNTDNVKALFSGLPKNKSKKNTGDLDEEFKMLEDDDDNEDLLDQKENYEDTNEFHKNEQLQDLKNQIIMNVPGMLNCQIGNPQIGHHGTNNNTEAGDTEASEEQAFQLAQLKFQMESD